MSDTFYIKRGCRHSVPCEEPFVSLLLNHSAILAIGSKSKVWGSNLRVSCLYEPLDSIWVTHSISRGGAGIQYLVRSPLYLYFEIKNPKNSIILDIEGWQKWVWNSLNLYLCYNFRYTRWGKVIMKKFKPITALYEKKKVNFFINFQNKWNP